MRIKNKAIFLLFLLIVFGCVISCDIKKKDVKKESGVKEESVGLFPIEQNAKYGYINKLGEIVIDPQIDYAWNFREGLAQVKIGGKADSNSRRHIGCHFHKLFEGKENLFFAKTHLIKASAD